MKVNNKNRNVTVSLNKNEKEFMQNSLKNQLYYKFLNQMRAENKNNESKMMNDNMNCDMENEQYEKDTLIKIEKRIIKYEQDIDEDFSKTQLIAKLVE